MAEVELLQLLAVAVALYVVVPEFTPSALFNVCDIVAPEPFAAPATLDELCVQLKVVPLTPLGLVMVKPAELPEHTL